MTRDEAIASAPLSIQTAARDTIAKARMDLGDELDSIQLRDLLLDNLPLTVAQAGIVLLAIGEWNTHLAP